MVSATSLIKMLCSPSLLRPQYERPIQDIRMTERSTQIVDSDILASQNRYLYCFDCGKKLNSKAGKTLHDKMHERELVKRRRQSRQPKRRVYTCKECNEQFSQKRFLNNHAKLHHKLIEYTLDGSNLDQLDAPPAYCTRSHSRMSCQNSRPSSCDAGFYSMRADSPASDCEQELLNTRLARSRSSTDVRHSGGGGGGGGGDGSARRKAHSVETWLRTKHYDGRGFDGSISERSASPASSLWSSARSDTTYAQPSQYLCSHPSCLKTFPTLNWLTTHEIAEHKMLALFRCKECRKRFTTLKNLRRHRIDNHPNVVICVLCDHAQKGVAAIEEHFQLHRKYSVKCEVCGKLFLSKYYLDEHLKQTLRVHKNVAPCKSEILLRCDKRETRNFTIIHDVFDKMTDIGLLGYSGQPLEPFGADFGPAHFVDNLPWRT